MGIFLTIRKVIPRFGKIYRLLLVLPPLFLAFYAAVYPVTWHFGLNLLTYWTAVGEAWFHLLSSYVDSQVHEDFFRRWGGGSDFNSGGKNGVHDDKFAATNSKLIGWTMTGKHRYDRLVDSEYATWLWVGWRISRCLFHQKTNLLYEFCRPSTSFRCFFLRFPLCLRPAAWPSRRRSRRAFQQAARRPSRCLPSPTINRRLNHNVTLNTSKRLNCTLLAVLR